VTGGPVIHYIVVSQQAISHKDNLVEQNIQHATKLASANQANLNRPAAGLTLGELGRETSHDRYVCTATSNSIARLQYVYDLYLRARCIYDFAGTFVPRPLLLEMLPASRLSPLGNSMKIALEVCRKAGNKYF
jgi:hypothetical protein